MSAWYNFIYKCEKNAKIELCENVLYYCYSMTAREIPQQSIYVEYGSTCLIPKLDIPTYRFGGKGSDATAPDSTNYKLPIHGASLY